MIGTAKQFSAPFEIQMSEFPNEPHMKNNWSSSATHPRGGSTQKPRQEPASKLTPNEIIRKNIQIDFVRGGCAQICNHLKHYLNKRLDCVLSKRHFLEERRRAAAPQIHGSSPDPSGSAARPKNHPQRSLFRPRSLLSCPSKKHIKILVGKKAPSLHVV